MVQRNKQKVFRKASKRKAPHQYGIFKEDFLEPKIFTRVFIPSNESEDNLHIAFVRNAQKQGWPRERIEHVVETSFTKKGLSYLFRYIRFKNYRDLTPEVE